MQLETVIDPNIEEVVLGVKLTSEDVGGFIERHGTLVDEIRGELVGVLALGEASKNEQLRERFDTDYERLTDEQRDVLVRPTREDIDKLREVFLTKRTLLKAVRALDAQRQSRELTGGEEHIPHQQEILDDILAALSSGKKEGYVELATAGGKTYIESKLADVFVQAGLRVLILAPTIQIATQIVGEDGKKGFGKFVSSATTQHVGKQFGDVKAKPTDTVVISTYQSFNRFVEDGRLGEFDVVLCDEAHRALGKITGKNITAAYPHAIKLGFTATPNFGVNKSVNEILPHAIHRLNLREAIDSNIVSPVQCLVYGTGEEIKVRDPYHRDFTDRELQRLISLKSRNEKALKFSLDFVQDGRQGIIACLPGENLAHARLMAEELGNLDIVDKRTGEKRKIVARAVGSSIMSDQERNEILRQYEAGEIDILTFVNVLGEGWDSQRASFLINLCPTTSIVKITQQIGRVARLKENGLHSIVVDFVDNVVGKEQKTALHALGEQTIQLGMVFGGYGRYESPQGGNTYLRGILSNELYDQLMFYEGRLIAELTLSDKGRHDQDRRQFEYYERLLRRDGLYPDTHLMGLSGKALDALSEAEDSYLSEYHREPTPLELLDRIDMKKLGKRIRYNIPEILRLALQSRNYELCGLMIDDNEVADYPFDPVYGDPQELEVVTTNLLATSLNKALSDLNDRERRIIRLRFNLDRQGPNTLDMLGKEFGVNRERIRQIESKSLAKLRHSHTSRELAAYLEEDWRRDPKEKEHAYGYADILKKISQEPIGFQALLLNILSPAERKTLFSKHYRHFPPVIQQYLHFITSKEGEETEYKNGDHGFSYNHIASVYDITKRFIKGEYNDLLPFVPVQLREKIVQFVGRIPRVLIYDKDAVPGSLSELKGGVASANDARDFTEMLFSLEESKKITDKVLEVHREIQKTRPEHVVPDRKDIAYLYGSYFSLVDYKKLYPEQLQNVWLLPKMQIFVERALCRPSISSYTKFKEVYDTVSISRDQIGRLLNAYTRWLLK